MAVPESEETGMNSSRKTSVKIESSITDERSSSYVSKRDGLRAQAWRITINSTSKRAVGREVSAVESSGVVLNFGVGVLMAGQPALLQTNAVLVCSLSLIHI